MIFPKSVLEAMTRSTSSSSSLSSFADFPWGDNAKTLDGLQQSFLIILLNAHRSHPHPRKEQISAANGGRGKVMSVGAAREFF